MNRFISKSFALVALVGGMTLVSAASSEAALQVWICNDYSCLGGGDVNLVRSPARLLPLLLAGMMGISGCTGSNAGGGDRTNPGSRSIVIASFDFPESEVLASNEASFVTGQNLHINGGMTVA